MILPDVLLATLATGALLDAYLNGSLFEPWREHVRARRREAPDSLIWKLTGCGFCLSYHVGFWLVALMAPGWLWGGYWRLPSYLVYALAATRLANLLNAALPEELRHDGVPE